MCGALTGYARTAAQQSHRYVNATPWPRHRQRIVSALYRLACQRYIREQRQARCSTLNTRNQQRIQKEPPEKEILRTGEHAWPHERGHQLQEPEQTTSSQERHRRRRQRFLQRLQELPSDSKKRNARAEQGGGGDIGCGPNAEGCQSIGRTRAHTSTEQS